VQNLVLLSAMSPFFLKPHDYCVLTKCKSVQTSSKNNVTC